MNKKKYVMIIVAALILVVAIFLIFYGENNKTQVVLDTVKVSKGDITTSVTATGTIEPIKLVEVGTQVSGVISKIYVDYNSVVKKGDILAEIDKNLLQSELESARANLQSRQVELENQQRTYNRQKMLWDKQAISKADWEAAETNYKTAQLAVTSQKAALLKAETNLGYATIYSTIDGVVVSRDVEEGQTVASSFNTPTLFTIANDLTKMRVIAKVDEADIGGIKDGQRVVFAVDAFPDDEFNGSVVQVRLQATTESNVVTYEVVIDAPNPDLKLKPGLTASVNIYTMEEKGLVTIPSKALRFRAEPEVLTQIKGIVIDEVKTTPTLENKKLKTIWIKSGNTIHPKTITTGATNGILTEVLSGVELNEEVITGISVKSNEEKMPKQAGGESSPFMPQRPGGNKKK